MNDFEIYEQGAKYNEFVRVEPKVNYVAMDSDLQKFVDLYASFGVDVKALHLPETGHFEIILARSNLYWMDEKDRITTSSKFGGYTGFYSTVEFDATGKFVKQEFLE